MRDRPGGDPTGVRAADLAAASAVVVRFRRRRRATVAAACSVAVAVVVSSRVFYEPATSSLVPTDDPHVTAGPLVPSFSPRPAPSVPPASPAAGQAPPAGAPAGPRPGTGVAPPAPGGTAPDPAERVEARPRISRVAVVRATGYGRRTPKSCGGINPLPTAPELCLGAWAAQERAGGAVSLRYGACPARQPHLSDVQLTFPTALEVEYAIQHAGRTLWVWSKGQRFAQSAHRVAVTSACVEWRTLWNGRLDDGRRVPSGRYVLRAAGRDAEGRLHVRTTSFQVRY